MAEINLPEGAAASTPPAGVVTLYAKSDGKLYSKDDAGTETELGASGSGSGDVVGPASSVDSEIALFDSTTGKLIKRATGSGIAKITSGVLGTAAAGTDYLAPAAIGVTVQGYDVDTLKSDTTKTLTAGYTVTPYNAGTKSSGTFTPDPANGNQQYCTNGGAFTLAPPSSATSIVLEVLNNGSAGAVTTSGFTKVTGSFTTTNGDKFACNIVKTQNYSLLQIQALQ